MTIVLMVLACVVVVAMVGLLLAHSNGSPSSSVPPGSTGAVPNPVDPASLFIASASESAARAAKVLPDGPSEDAGHVLGTPPAPPKVHVSNPRAEWIIQVEFRDGAIASREKILSVLNPEWLRENDSPTVSGLSPETGHWTRLNAPEVPDAFSALQVGWRYLPLDPGLSVTFDTAERWLRALIAAASRIAPATVHPSELPSAAERHARALEALRSDLQDAEIMIGLVAPKDQPFEGRALWDALSSLGLEWGDGDLFHWVNPAQESGDDSLFDVSTSTPPGYFLPEEVIDGRLNVGDLSFSMSIPRTHEPALVLDAMIRAARFVQQRLGGTLVAAPTGAALDEESLRKSLSLAVERMKEAGIKPGSEEALQLF